jgi:hypothetical protein
LLVEVYRPAVRLNLIGIIRKLVKIGKLSPIYRIEKPALKAAEARTAGSSGVCSVPVAAEGVAELALT